MKPHSQRSSYVAWVGMLGHLKRPDILIEIARKAPDHTIRRLRGTHRVLVAAWLLGQIVQDLRSTTNIDYLGQVSAYHGPSSDR